jgi:type III pantothenate kinase
MASALRRAFRAAGAPAPRFVQSPRRAAGVINGYRVPQRLGVDRWLGLVAARDRYPASPVCVIGIGTAMTVDLLDRHGRHRGGAIAPGPQLMVSALLAHTALIRARAAQGRVPVRQRLFATDTRAAIAGGSLHACAALIPHALLEARGLLGARPRLLLTGGAADAVRRAAGLRVRVVDDLVLRGLAVLARRRTR